MHKLGRAVRFSLNPFLDEDAEGSNSYSSRPAGDGFALFFELGVELEGEVNRDTGFVANVVDVDSCVRAGVVPIFAAQVREDFKCGRHIGFSAIARLLRLAWGQLSDKFDGANVCGLSLRLNPFRKIAIDSEGSEMIYFSEKFEFAATHKLWNDKFSDEKNNRIFGKCANPTGHGHNYVFEVTVKAAADGDEMGIGDFEEVVDGRLVKMLDHKNLNVDVEHFSKVIPTVENLAAFGWEKLVGKFGEAKLHCVTVWETDKTYSSYYGD